MGYSYDRRLAALTAPFDARRLERIQKDAEMFLKNVDTIQSKEDFDQVHRGAVAWSRKLDKDLQAVHRYLRDAAVSDPKVKNYDRQIDTWYRKVKPLHEVKTWVTPIGNWEDWNHPTHPGRWRWHDKLKAALDGFPAMIKFWKGLAKRRKIRPTVPDASERNMALEGFKATLVGFDPDDAEHVDALNRVKASLKKFKARAGRVLPTLVKRMVPMVLRFDVKDIFGKAGQLGVGKIDVYPLNISKVDRFVHTIAHELAHHHGIDLLSQKAKAFWIKAFKGDWGKLDLREVLKRWPDGMSRIDWLEKLKTKDPVLYLQFNSLDYGHIKSPGLKDFRKDGLEKYLAEGGDPKISVPMSPTTSYGASNPDEAFAEAIALLVAYGPKAVHPEVMKWLRMIMPVKLAYDGSTSTVR